MSDDTYKDEINEILFYLNSNRVTGRTNRLVNEIVEKLFIKNEKLEYAYNLPSLQRIF